MSAKISNLEKGDVAPGTDQSNLIGDGGDNVGNNVNNKFMMGGMDTLGIGNGPPPSTTATAIAGAQTPAPAPKRPARRGGKAQPERPVRALFCLGLKNPIRKLCIEIVELKYPFLNKYYYDYE